MASKTGRMAPCTRERSGVGVSWLQDRCNSEWSEDPTYTRVTKNVLDAMSQHHLVDDGSTRLANEAKQPLEAIVSVRYYSSAIICSLAHV
jgi:hypothetical protein